MLATFTVTTTADAGAGSLRDAVAQANTMAGADDIVFDMALNEATIALTSTQLEITDEVTIDASALDRLTIDASGLDTTPGTPDGGGGRIFDVLAVTAEFRGLTLQNGDVTGDGGAIRATGSLNIVDSTIENSFAQDGRGGGLFLQTSGGSFTVSESTLSGNGATGNGGGVYALLDDATMLLARSTIQGNSAGGSGGGLHVMSDNNSTATIRRSTVFENRSDDGGGLYLMSDNDGSAIVSNSTVSNNESTDAGGGLTVLRAERNAVMRIQNSTVVDNTAASGGATGIYGGGVHVNSASYHLLVDDSIVAGNVVDETGDDASGLVSANFSLFENTTAMSFITGNGLIFNQDPVLGPLANNGGPTPTHNLLAGSPAIDTGSLFFNGTFDQRGAPYDRVLDGDENGTAIVDMGAIEAQPISNLPPVADAGDNQMTTVNVPATLDGSNSFDPDEGPDPLSYMWRVVAGSGDVQFSAPDAAVTEFTADSTGTYVLLLTVSDGSDEDSDSVNVVVVRENNPPVADVSLSENSGRTNQPIELNGSRSSDPDMDPLTFSWSVITQPEGSSPVIDDASAEITSLVVDEEGTYRVQLIVSDGLAQSDPVTFTIDVIEVNLPPIADVSLSQNSGTVFSLIGLDGTRSSDPEGEPLTYLWSIIDEPAGANGMVVLPTMATATFFADTVGTYRIQLVVNDGVHNSDPVTFTLDVTENLPPVADVSLSENMGVAGVPLVLDGTRSSDPEGGTIGYSWSIVDQPAGSSFEIADPSADRTTVTFDTVGEYRAQLIVSDGINSSDPVRFVIQIDANQPPVANVSLSHNSGINGIPILMDGSRSTDPEEQPLEYHWSIIDQPAGSNFEIAESSEMDLGQAMLSVDTEGVYRAQLIVNDGINDSAPVTYQILVGPNQPPIANVSLSQDSGVVAVPIGLDGTRSSDPEDQPLGFSWQLIDQPSGSNASFTSPEKSVGDFVADTVGDYRVQLIVNDGIQDSDPVRFVIHVEENLPPTADVSLSQNSGVVAVPIGLDGTRSTDPENQPLNYSWQLIDQPSGSNATFSAPDQALSDFMADTVGAYRVQLTVNDGFQDSPPVRFVINVDENLPPVANVSLSQNSGAVDAPIRLDGSRSSDPEGQPLTYRWDVVDQPPGSNIETMIDGAVGFLTMDTEGEYRVQLVVSDGFQDSDTVTFVITVGPNLAPTADVSLSQNTGLVDSLIALDGSRSSDPEGQPLMYDWEVLLQPAGSQFEIEDPTEAATTFSADTVGPYRVQLTVNDGLQNSDPVTFLVDVTSDMENGRPVADVSLSGSTGVVALFTELNGTRSSDPNEDLLTYLWSVVDQPDGSQFGIINEMAAQTQITFDTPGLYRIQLVVNDGLLDSFPVTFVIDVASPASSGMLPEEASGQLLQEQSDDAAEENAWDAFFAAMGR